MKDIINQDSNGDFHGYQEWCFNNKITSRAIYKHGRTIGYVENHGTFIKKTYFYIK